MHNNTKNMDFVVPIKKMGMFTQSVLEGISIFYEPKRIIVVTSKSEIPILHEYLRTWKIGCVEMIDESVFFMEHFALTMDDLEKVFQTSSTDTNHREFGWWYQQMIKLGASSQIDNISENYVVWDGDLIPLQKWELVVTVNNDLNNKNNTKNINNDTKKHYIAILQNQSRSPFNKEEYQKCIEYLLGFPSFCPSKEGTFVSHHMVFNRIYVKEMLETILDRKKTRELWPSYFISLSHTFYRFSEYMLYASFMVKNHPEEFFYHPYELYGKTGLRFRDQDTKEIIENLREKYGSENNGFLSYQNIVDFFNEKKYSYVQLEHVYNLL